jgi:hypothetical protein
MNKRSKLATGVLAAVTVIALALGGCSRGSSDHVGTDLFADRLDPSIQYKNRHEKELPRQIWHAKNQMVERARVPFESGKVAYIEYWTDGPGAGNIKSGVVHYPPAKGQTEGPIWRQFERDVNGTALVKDLIFREDGTVEHSGAQLKPGLYSTLDYFEDGKQIKDRREFAQVNDHWLLAFEELMRRDATVAKRVTMLQDNSQVTLVFSDKQVLESKTTSDQWHTFFNTDSYEADGVTVRMHVEESRSSITIDNFKDGKRVEERNYENGWYQFVNTVEVTTYDTNGNALVHTSFTLKKGLFEKFINTPVDQLPKLDPSMLIISGIEYYDAKGNIAKRIGFLDGTQTPSEVTLQNTPKDGQTTIKSFRADGTLEHVVVIDESGSQVSSEDHQASENIREPIDNDLITPKAIDIPHRHKLGAPDVSPLDEQDG